MRSRERGATQLVAVLLLLEGMAFTGLKCQVWERIRTPRCRGDGSSHRWPQHRLFGTKCRGTAQRCRAAPGAGGLPWRGDALPVCRERGEGLGKSTVRRGGRAGAGTGSCPMGWGSRLRASPGLWDQLPGPDKAMAARSLPALRCSLSPGSHHLCETRRLALPPAFHPSSLFPSPGARSPLPSSPGRRGDALSRPTVAPQGRAAHGPPGRRRAAPCRPLPLCGLPALTQLQLFPPALGSGSVLAARATGRPVPAHLPLPGPRPEHRRSTLGKNPPEIPALRMATTPDPCACACGFPGVQTDLHLPGAGGNVAAAEVPEPAPGPGDGRGIVCAERSVASVLPL